MKCQYMMLSYIKKNSERKYLTVGCTLWGQTNIRTLIFKDLKNLTDISELAFPSLNRFICYTGSVRKDNKIKEMIEKYNKQA